MSDHHVTVGDRVRNNSNGDIGHIEELDGDFADVRLLTPNNTPSCYVSCCPLSALVPISDAVVPTPKSEAWWEESRAFCAAIEFAIREASDE